MGGPVVNAGYSLVKFRGGPSSKDNWSTAKKINNVANQVRVDMCAPAVSLEGHKDEAVAGSIR